MGGGGGGSARRARDDDTDGGGGARRYATRVFDHAVVCCCLPLRSAVFLAGISVALLAVALVVSRTATEDALRVFIGGYAARSRAVVNLVQVLGIFWGPIGASGAWRLHTSAVKLFMGYQLARLLAWFWMFNVDIPLLWNCELWSSDVKKAAQIYGWNDTMFEISVDQRCASERASFLVCSVPTLLFAVYCATATQQLLAELEDEPAYLFKGNKAAPSGAFYTRSLASRSLAEQMKEEAEARARRKQEAEEDEEQKWAAAAAAAASVPGPEGLSGASLGGLPLGGSLPLSGGSLPLSSAPPPPPPPGMPGSAPCGPASGGSFGFGGAGSGGGGGFLPAACGAPPPTGASALFGPSQAYEGLFALPGAPPSLPPSLPPPAGTPLGGPLPSCGPPLPCGPTQQPPGPLAAAATPPGSPHFGPAPLPAMDDGFLPLGAAPFGSQPLGPSPLGSLLPLGGSQPLGSGPLPGGFPPPSGHLPPPPPWQPPASGGGGLPPLAPAPVPPGLAPFASSLPPLGPAPFGSLPPGAAPAAVSMPALGGGSGGGGPCLAPSSSPSSLRIRERL